MELIPPKCLRAGDPIGVAATSSPIHPDLLQAGLEELSNLGFEPRVLEGVQARHLYMAGTDDRRAQEVNAFLRDPEIRAVFCARGGYGWPRILDRIDWDALRRDPKPLLGFSDATVALAAAQTRSGVIAFHGPMVAWDLRQGESAYDRTSLLGAMTRAEPLGRLNPDGLSVLRPGTAEGVLVGGCLSLLASLVGTPWMPDTKDCLLFLEDWKSKPYQIDRMLQQLRHSGHLSEVRGVVFGQMLECRQQQDDEYTLAEVLLECLEPALPEEAPVVMGFPSGHVDRPNVTLPLGVVARLTGNGTDAGLEILQAAVQP